MLLDVLIVNFNTGHLIAPMLEAMECSKGVHSMRYLMVDNASTDDSIRVLEENYPEIDVIANKLNVGFGRANNQLLPGLQGRYVLLLNTDAFVSNDTIASTLNYMEHDPSRGVLGVRLVGRDGDVQPSCRYFPTPVNLFLTRTGLGRFFPWVRLIDSPDGDPSSISECDWVPGCYYLVRREVIEQVGLFDPRFFLYCEEVDHCKRVKAAGWRVIFYPLTTVVHIGGESAKSQGVLTSAGRQLSALQVESEMLYVRKHHGALGLVLHAVLVAFGAAFMSLKGLLKGLGWQSVAGPWSYCVVNWKLLIATGFATKATR